MEMAMTRSVRYNTQSRQAHRVLKGWSRGLGRGYGSLECVK